MPDSDQSGRSASPSGCSSATAAGSARRTRATPSSPRPSRRSGSIRLAPLFYGALACIGLFVGARRWLGRYGGSAAVALFCSSGAAMLFAWRDYMPTFTDASLIAAGSGALLWVLLAKDAGRGRRTVMGLLAFLALEAAVFVRYTDVVVLGCAVLTVLALWRFSRSTVSTRALAWWLGSVVLFAAVVALFDDLVYGGPFKSGYGPGEITFSLSSILPNFRYMPAHLVEAMPMLFLGLGALVWTVWHRVRLRARLVSGELAASARCDFAVALALAASWFSVWGLYSAYTWTASPYGTTLQFARFYVPALGAISIARCLSDRPLVACRETCQVRGGRRRRCHLRVRRVVVRRHARSRRAYQQGADDHQRGGAHERAGVAIGSGHDPIPERVLLTVKRNRLTV